MHFFIQFRIDMWLFFRERYPRPSPYCARVQHANHSATKPPSCSVQSMYICWCCYRTVLMLVEQRRNSTQFAVKSPTWRISMWVGFFNLLFLPAQHYYASAGTSCGPLSVCLSVSVTSLFCRSSWTNRAGFRIASFHLSYTVLKGHSSISKNYGTSLWNFCPKLQTSKNLLRHIDRQNVLST